MDLIALTRIQSY